jgi:hypothetical protein
MTDIILAIEDRETTNMHSSLPSDRVSPPRFSARGFASAGNSTRDSSACYYEEYVIAIGSWKATVVKMFDYGDGRTRFRSRHDAGQENQGRTKPAARGFRRRKWQRNANN